MGPVPRVIDLVVRVAAVVIQAGEEGCHGVAPRFLAARSTVSTPPRDFRQDAEGCA